MDKLHEHLEEGPAQQRGEYKGPGEINVLGVLIRMVFVS